MRRLSLIAGLVLAVLVAAGLVLFVNLSRPRSVLVPIAVGDIPAGTVVQRAMFRGAEMANVDAETLDAWVLASDFNQAVGRRLNSDVRAGFPVARAQIDPNAVGAIETRLSLAVPGSAGYYLPIPVTPDQVGNFIQPGDRIDLLVHIGSISARELNAGPPSGGAQQPASTKKVSETLGLPVTKLIVQNLEIIRVERDAAPRASQNQAQTVAREPARPGDVRRLYALVTRDQLEVLTFALRNGDHSFAVRGAGNTLPPAPTDAVTWNDFERWLFAQRGPQPAPFAPVTAYQP